MYICEYIYLKIYIYIYEYIYNILRFSTDKIITIAVALHSVKLIFVL